MTDMVGDMVRVFLDPLNLIVVIVLAFFTMIVLKRIFKEGEKENDSHDDSEPRHGRFEDR